jgi:hypothetical protein
MCIWLVFIQYYHWWCTKPWTWNFPDASSSVQRWSNTWGTKLMSMVRRKKDYWLKRSEEGITCFTVWYIFVPTSRTGQKRIKSCNKILRRNKLAIIHVENRLRNGQAGFRISVGTRNFFSSPKAQVSSDVHSASYSVHLGCISPGG